MIRRVLMPRFMYVIFFCHRPFSKVCACSITDIASEDSIIRIYALHFTALAKATDEYLCARLISPWLSNVSPNSCIETTSRVADFMSDIEDNAK